VSVVRRSHSCGISRLTSHATINPRSIKVPRNQADD